MSTNTTESTATRHDYSYSVVEGGLNILVNRQVHPVSKSHPFYAQIKQGLRDGIPEEQMAELITPAKRVSRFILESGIVAEVSEDGIKLDGLPANVPGLVERIMETLEQDLPAAPLMNFLANVLKNPSYKARGHVFRYVDAHNLPITPDGCFLGYRGLEADYWSKHGNLQTVVLHGKTDDRGRIFNGIGEYIEIDRGCVDDNENSTCSQGLHVGSETYALNWAGGCGHMVIVKVNPKDVVTVPASEVEKMRVCAYTVTAEHVGTLPEGQVADATAPYDAQDADDDDDADDTTHYCPNCGAAHDGTGNYCVECGARLNDS